MHTFQNVDNIWILENNEKIPMIYDRTGNFHFERPAQINVDIFEQIELSNLILPLIINENIAYKLDISSSNAQFGKVMHFWILGSTNEVQILDRKLVVKTGIQFLKPTN